MYTKILVAIENSAADRAVLEHVEALVNLTGFEKRPQLETPAGVTAPPTIEFDTGRK